MTPFYNVTNEVKRFNEWGWFVLTRTRSQLLYTHLRVCNRACKPRGRKCLSHYQVSVCQLGRAGEAAPVWARLVRLWGQCAMFYSNRDLNTSRVGDYIHWQCTRCRLVPCIMDWPSLHDDSMSRAGMSMLLWGQCWNCYGLRVAIEPFSSHGSPPGSGFRVPTTHAWMGVKQIPTCFQYFHVLS